MERLYNTTGATTTSEVSVFVGIEIERTPAFGKSTLFLAGRHSLLEIKRYLADRTVEHIFFGANHSFNELSWAEWKTTISPFLHTHLCSLDIPLSEIDKMPSALNLHRNFIPQIRVPIPNIRGMNYNTTIKLDDIGFNLTNPGVWAHSLSELQSRATFTPWIDYAKDEIIK